MKGSFGHYLTPRAFQVLEGLKSSEEKRARFKKLNQRYQARKNVAKNPHPQNNAAKS